MVITVLVVFKPLFAIICIPLGPKSTEMDVIKESVFQLCQAQYSRKSSCACGKVFQLLDLVTERMKQKSEWGEILLGEKIL